MKLLHYTHERGRAEIVDTEDANKIVGHSRREPFPLGGYIYTITNTEGARVYKGNSMKSGLAALAAHLSGTA
jgi:hypothetical protein